MFLNYAVAEFHCHCNYLLQANILKSTSFLKTFNLIIFQRVSINNTRETQETWPFSAFKNVHEEDTASLSYSASPCTSCLPPWTRNILPTTHHYSPGSSPHIPYYNSWRSLVYCDNGRNREQRGEGCFSEAGGRALYLVSLSGTTEAAKSQMGRLNQGSNIRTERQKSPKISRRPITTCPEAEGETLYCSPLLPPPPLYPHYLWDGLTRRAASPGSVSGSLYVGTHYIN